MPFVRSVLLWILLVPHFAEVGVVASRLVDVVLGDGEDAGLCAEPTTVGGPSTNRPRIPHRSAPRKGPDRRRGRDAEGRGKRALTTGRGGSGKESRLGVGDFGGPCSRLTCVHRSLGAIPRLPPWGTNIKSTSAQPVRIGSLKLRGTPDIPGPHLVELSHKDGHKHGEGGHHVDCNLGEGEGVVVARGDLVLALLENLEAAASAAAHRPRRH